MNGPCENTDRVLWRDRGDFHDDTLHVTEEGGIGINCGGTVFVMTLRDWHDLASGAIIPAPTPTSGNDETPEDRVARIKRRWEAGFGPVATTPIEMLEFLRDRFRMGVGQAVAESYAEDIDMMLAGIVPTSGNDEVTDALRLILPLAKGHMAAHPIESNIRYVHTAEAALANVDAHPPVQPTELPKVYAPCVCSSPESIKLRNDKDGRWSCPRHGHMPKYPPVQPTDERAASIRAKAVALFSDTPANSATAATEKTE